MNNKENKIIIIPFNIEYRAARFIKEQMRDPNQSNETTFKIILSCHSVIT
jgi:prolipoprotein diacylglyceryltransferase